MFLPTIPPDDGPLGAWIYGELQRLSQEQNLEIPFIMLIERHSAPSHPRTGMVVLADGTDWDPGSGAGVYCYYGASWNKLG